MLLMNGGRKYWLAEKLRIRTSALGKSMVNQSCSFFSPVLVNSHKKSA